MKYFLIILIFCPLVIMGQNEKAERTRYFPKEEQKIEKLPCRENVWVFVFAGQSNMAGRGLVEPQDTIPHERILTINKNGEIILAKEPVNIYEPTMTGLDCSLSFARTLIGHIPDSISVLLIPTAIGGSTISQWLGDSVHRNYPLLTHFREKLEIGAKYGQIKGFLWHQGEGDANDTGIPLYKDRLAELFKKFREFAGNENIPVLVGELGWYSPRHEYWMRLNEQIRIYAASDSIAVAVSTSGLKDKGDKLHFDSEGQRIMGQRFAEAYIGMMKK